ncbi:MAG TPA: methionyl-tRNA formyltransferase [Ktedonobacteraceae bacterium]|nr:methionyl-tRNA formyltransferase [Ktedonobacteraceae bacterium]
MTKTLNTVVFFGSGPVAAASLQRLVQCVTVEAVITKPRPHHHKGPVPVLDLATELGIPVFTATNKRELDALFSRKPVKSRLGVLIDFGIIVSQSVIDYFPLGIINSHFSILPEWRGADPISFAILSGQQTTGVSLMFLTAGLDEGNLLAYAEQTIAPDATTPTLTTALINLSDDLLRKDLPNVLACTPGDDTLRGFPQETTGRKLSYSRKLSKEDSQLDWQKPAQQLQREIRAFIEWPKSRAFFGNLEVIITDAHVDNSHGQAGQTTIIDKKPAVFCSEGCLIIDQIKPAGKQEMTGEAFLAGYRQTFLG